MAQETTTIAVKNRTADQLWELKGRSETYDDLIQELIENSEAEA